jgi:hypothetical protein
MRRSEAPGKAGEVLTSAVPLAGKASCTAAHWWSTHSSIGARWQQMTRLAQPAAGWLTGFLTQNSIDVTRSASATRLPAALSRCCRRLAEATSGQAAGVSWRMCVARTSGSPGSLKSPPARAEAGSEGDSRKLVGRHGAEDGCSGARSPDRACGPGKCTADPG